MVAIVKYFLDTEFNEAVDPVEIISLGVVAEDGREFYAIGQRYAFDESPGWATANEWIRKNVQPILAVVGVAPDVRVNTIGDAARLRDTLRDFVGNDPFPEFWAYYGAYDWYLVCRLFGSFGKMPKNWPNICFDIKQLARHLGVGNKSFPDKFTPEHNALIDARWTKHVYEFITKGGYREMK
jgi:hypothetical protein